MKTQTSKHTSVIEQSSKRFIVYIDGIGRLTSCVAGHPGPGRGFKPLIKINRPLTLERARNAYGALIQIYDL